MRTKRHSPEQQAELARFVPLADDQIDTVDIPESPAENWRRARRGAFYRPVKQPVTPRLDVDVVGWFKARAPSRGYQTEINRVLTSYVEQIERRPLAP